VFVNIIRTFHSSCFHWWLLHRHWYHWLNDAGLAGIPGVRLKQLDLIDKGTLHPVKTDWMPPDSFPDLSSAKMISVDLETCDPDLKTKGPGTRRGAFIAGVAIGTDDGFRGYYPIAHQLGGNMDRDTVLRWAKEELGRSSQPKVGAHLIYDLEFLAVADVPVAGKLYDVQYAEPLLDEHKLSYSLDNIAKERLGEGKVSNAMYDWITMAYGKQNPGNHIWEAPVGLVGPYAEGDVDLPLRILESQRKELREQNLEDLFEMECSLLPMLLAMRLNGVRVDVPKAERIGAGLQKEITRWQKELNVLCGFQCNINSAGHLSRIFDKLHIPYLRTKPTKSHPNGQPSFQKKWLEKLNLPNPEIQLILGLRKYTTILNTFIKGYIIGQNVNGRLYGMFHPLRTDENGTISGRFSSSLPNLQNIPMRDKTLICVDGVMMRLGKAIRSCFLPEEDCLWVKDDYSQVEFRLITQYGTGPEAEAARSEYVNDPTTDFHALVGRMCGIDRDPAKTINFGLAYVMGVEKLAEDLGVSVEEAEELFKTYHARVPFVQSLQKATSRVASNRGYIRTLMNRRARFPFWESTDWDTAHANAPKLDKEWAVELWGTVRRAETWTAMNKLIQGSAADVMKKAMKDVWDSGVFDVLKIHLTVHDELDFSQPKTKEADEAAKEMLHIMENCVKLKIPLACDTESGPSWGEVE
jgi:DNA polymerase I-like protein with 3'-5' exonuclease and polymerase domains